MIQLCFHKILSNVRTNHYRTGTGSVSHTKNVQVGRAVSYEINLLLRVLVVKIWPNRFYWWLEMVCFASILNKFTDFGWKLCKMYENLNFFQKKCLSNSWTDKIWSDSTTKNTLKDFTTYLTKTFGWP